MSFDYIPARPVIDSCLQILHQRSIQPHIQALCAVTDSQDRLVQIEGILEQQFVHGGAGRVRLAALWNRIFAISLWVNIESAARQQDSLHPRQQPCYAVLTFVKWNNNRRCPGGTRAAR